MTPPKTKEGWCLYRAELACKVGRDALNGKSEAHDPTKHALFNILYALEDLVSYLQLKEQQTKDQP
jgi:hypothetical protein